MAHPLSQSMGVIPPSCELLNLTGTVGKVELISTFTTAVCGSWNVSDKYTCSPWAGKGSHPTSQQPCYFQIFHVNISQKKHVNRKQTGIESLFTHYFKTALKHL